MGMNGQPRHEYSSREQSSHNAFRQYCASALTHPATVAALAVLLLNDLLFKALWPHAWVTGKLSDLGWMVFAPPLLVFLLSLGTCRNRTAERIAFLTAYVGLPLLYVAFNTFAPVHDAIMRGLLPLTGAAYGSPLDAADSLMIPPGMGVAWWVWRRPSAGPSRLRTRLGLLTAAAAAFAAVASVPNPVAQGVTHLATEADGTVIAAATYQFSTPDYFASTDGGLTWREGDPTPRTLINQAAPKRQLVRTPQGEYRIEGATIVLITHDGRRVEAYSAAHLGSDSNRWVQYRSTGKLQEQPKQQERYTVERIVTTEFKSIAYHAGTGSVVVAMGLQGVLVGTPDGRWTQVGADVYEPVDFSARAKLRLVLTDVYFWALGMAAAAAFAALALILSFARFGTRQLILGTGSGVLIASPLVVSGLFDAWHGVMLPFLLILFLPLPLAALSDPLAVVIKLYVAACSLLAVAGIWFTNFLVKYNEDQYSFADNEEMTVFLLIASLVTSATLALVYREHLRHRRVLTALLLAFAGLFAAIASAILWWLLTGVSVAFSTAAAFVISGLITFAVVRHLRTLQFV